MLSGLLSLSLLVAVAPPAAAPPAAHPSLAELDQKRFELHLGGRAGARALSGASFGGGVQIGLGVRLWRGLYLEAAVAEGVYTNPAADAEVADDGEAFRHLGTHDDDPIATGAAPDGPDGLLAGQILLGLRWEIRTPKTVHVRPSVFLGATHLHEATLAEFVDAPGKTLAGTGKFIRHRTGAQLGVGLRVPFPTRWGPVAPRFSLRVDTDVAYYFDALPGRLQAGLGLGVQAVF